MSCKGLCIINNKQSYCSQAKVAINYSFSFLVILHFFVYTWMCMTQHFLTNSKERERERNLLPSWIIILILKSELQNGKLPNSWKCVGGKKENSIIKKNLQNQTKSGEAGLSYVPQSPWTASVIAGLRGALRGRDGCWENAPGAFVQAGRYESRSFLTCLTWKAWKFRLRH